MSRLRVLNLVPIAIFALLLVSPQYAALAAKSTKVKPTAGREVEKTNTILSGKGSPKSSLGTNGDFYIDISSFTIYGPKKNGKWPSGVSLKGPQGPDGKAGDRGTSGVAGTGTKGDKGEKGDRGERGPAGEMGPQGATGATGPAGPAGATGAQGAAGPAGAQGAAGATGLQGLQGEKGDRGDAGPAGVTGSTGPKGDTGEPGPIGPSNVSVGSILFASSMASAPGEPITSETFGSLVSDSNYQVDLVVTGSGTSDISALPLSFEVLTEGSSRVITNVQWTNTSVQTLRNGSTVVMEHNIQARFAVNGSGTSTPSSLRVRLKAGYSTATKPVTFVGNYRIQKVGSVVQD